MQTSQGLSSTSDVSYSSGDSTSASGSYSYSSSSASQTASSDYSYSLTTILMPGTLDPGSLFSSSTPSINLTYFQSATLTSSLKQLTPISVTTVALSTLITYPSSIAQIQAAAQALGQSYTTAQIKQLASTMDNAAQKPVYDNEGHCTVAGIACYPL